MAAQLAKFAPSQAAVCLSASKIYGSVLQFLCERNRLISVSNKRTKCNASCAY
jgi:hypothetical protein